MAQELGIEYAGTLGAGAISRQRVWVPTLWFESTPRVRLTMQTQKERTVWPVDLAACSRDILGRIFQREVCSRCLFLEGSKLALIIGKILYLLFLPANYVFIVILSFLFVMISESIAATHWILRLSLYRWNLLLCSSDAYSSPTAQSSQICFTVQSRKSIFLI